VRADAARANARQPNHFTTDHTNDTDRNIREIRGIRGVLVYALYRQSVFIQDKLVSLIEDTRQALDRNTAARPQAAGLNPRLHLLGILPRPKEDLRRRPQDRRERVIMRLIVSI